MEQDAYRPVLEKILSGRRNMDNLQLVYNFPLCGSLSVEAEALVETGGSTDEAKSLIKVIRDRAGNTNDIDKMVAERYNGSLRDLVRNERRVELAQEGLRFADIRRWNILLDVMNKPIEGIEYRDFSSGTPKHTVLIPAERDAYTAKDFWWPIPQAEIDLNPGRITQNEGWK